MADIETTPAVKPGIRSTELWLTILAGVVAQIQAAGIEGTTGQIVAIAAAVLGALGYGLSRGIAKKGA